MPDSDPEPEFRRLPPDRLRTFREIAGYAFDPEDGSAAVETDADGPSDAGSVAGDDETAADADDADPTAGPGERFGVFVGDDLRSVCKHYDFAARLRGSWVPLAGLASVATPPEYRRRGYVRHLVAASLERWRGTAPLSALWPFDRGFYRQFGWATANTTVEYACPPETLASACDEASGQFRRVTADDWERLQAVHEAHAAERTLTIRRDEDWWRETVFRAGEDDRPYVYAWERDGQVRGYLVYEVESTGDDFRDRRLDVSDLAFADHEARLNLLGFLADHGSQASAVVHYHEDDDLLDLVADPSEVDCTVSAGPMVRVVDVERALEAVPYPEDATLDLTLAVTDGTAPWNDGVFRLAVADGTGRCTRHDSAPSAADASLDVGTLSQLVVGYRGVRAARRRGDLAAGAATAATLDTAFPPTTVYLRQFF